MTDQQALSRVLRQFARTMVSNYDITQVLYDLSDSVAEVLEATGAGVALLDGDDRLCFVTATDDTAAEAERNQERFQSGPCLDSIRQNRPVVVNDIYDFHDTWPDYAPAAEQIGFRAFWASRSFWTTDKSAPSTSTAPNLATGARTQSVLLRHSLTSVRPTSSTPASWSNASAPTSSSRPLWTTGW